MDKTRKGPHFAWFVMIGCGLMLAGSTTFYTVLIGNFFVPSAEDMGVEVSDLSLFLTAAVFAAAVTMPFAGNLLHKVPPLGLGFFAAIQSVAVGALSFSHSAVWWWIAGAVVGVGMAFTTIVCISTVLTNWFVKRTGLAIGITWAIASVISAVAGPLIVELIDAEGWRTGILIFASVGGVLATVPAIFLVRYSPDRKGMQAYGYEEGVEVVDEHAGGAGVSTKVVVTSLSFFAVALALGLTQIVSGINAFFPVYAETAFDPAKAAHVGAMMISVALIFDIFLNPLIGWFIDKYGAIKGFVVGGAIVVISFLLIMFSNGNELLVYLGAGLEDSLYVILGVGFASLCSTLWGTKNYAKNFAYLSVLGFGISAVGPYILTSLYEMTGSFDAVFMFTIGGTVAIVLLSILSSKLAKKLTWEPEDAK